LTACHRDAGQAGMGDDDPLKLRLEEPALEKLILRLWLVALAAFAAILLTLFVILFLL
jgi:hypothetical protein